jgi:chromosome segregation ATPase
MGEIACSDLISLKLDSEIKRRKKILLDTFKEVKETSDQNEFYQMILNDYSDYYKYMKNEKYKQISQLEIISKYLENLKKSSISLNEKNNNLKKDQIEILNQIQNLKNEINDLTDN